MRPKTAVKLLLAVSAILFLCVLFLSLLKEFFHDMRHNAGQQQAPLAAVSWPFITEAVDSDSPATFSPPKSFIWKGFDNNVAEVKELKGKKWVVSYRAKPTATEEGEKIVEGTLGSHEGVRHVEGLGGLKDVERRRPPVRTLETLEELPSSIPEKDEPRVIVLRKTIEPLDPAAQPSWQELDTSKPFQMKASESVSPHTLPPAVSYSSKRDSLQQQQTKPHASTSTPSGPANITHTGRDFSIKSYLSVPLPTFTRKTVLQDNWVRELQNYLRTLKTKQVSIVTANDEHEVVVLNWLISAIVVSNFSLENTLVLSLSQKLTSLLQSKNIPVVFVDPKSVISNSAKSLIRSGFSQVHIVRLTFFRLINHWGYDLVWYDSDATVLKNPQPLFDKYPEAGLVGSAGQGPSNLAGVWGRTICTGVLLMRSSQKMGEHSSWICRYLNQLACCVHAFVRVGPVWFPHIFFVVEVN